MEIFLNILSGVAIAGLSSFITVQLSMNRFKNEKWWEKKAEAYSTLIAAFYDAKSFTEEHLDAEIKNYEINSEHDNFLRDKSIKADNEINRAIHFGTLYLSQSAIERLISYNKEVEEAKKKESWADYLASESIVINSCLKDIISIARKDLQIK